MKAKKVLLENKSNLESEIPEESPVMVICVDSSKIQFEATVTEEIQSATLNQKELAKISLKAQSFQKAHADNKPIIAITGLSQIRENTDLPQTVSFLKTLMREKSKIIVIKDDQWPIEVRETIEPLFKPEISSR